MHPKHLRLRIRPIIRVKSISLSQKEDEREKKKQDQISILRKWLNIFAFTDPEDYKLELLYTCFKDLVKNEDEFDKMIDRMEWMTSKRVKHLKMYADDIKRCAELNAGAIDDLIEKYRIKLEEDDD